jgi:lipopolysaccharide assembly outer membrane protein LptD (OstA)
MRGRNYTSEKRSNLMQKGNTICKIFPKEGRIVKYKKLTKNLIIALLCFATTPAWAASPPPITLEAGSLYYNDANGEFHAIGNAKIQQGTTVIESNAITGNISSGDVVADGNVTWLDEDSKLTGEKLNYNYKTKNGQMGTTKGNIDGLIVSAESTTLMPESSTIYNTSVTKCPAQIPDYKMTADKVVIYPGEKIIAYNASFWIKNVKLFTIPKYSKKIDNKEGSASSFPRLGYDSDEGFYIKQHLEYPIKDRLSGVADLGYYSERGTKYQIGLVQENPSSTISMMSGSTQNSDGDWYERQPEISYFRHYKPVPKAPLLWAYQLKAADIKDSGDADFQGQETATLYLSHKPLRLSADSNLNLWSSFSQHWYETEDPRSVFNIGTRIDKTLNTDLNMYVGYNYTHESANSPFIYDDVDANREVVSGANWQVDRLWNIGVATSYDLDQERFADIDYKVKRNLHCFEAELIYREKRDEWKFRVNAIQW